MFSYLHLLYEEIRRLGQINLCLHAHNGTYLRVFKDQIQFKIQWEQLKAIIKDSLKKMLSYVEQTPNPYRLAVIKLNQSQIHLALTKNTFNKFPSGNSW